MRIPYGWLEDGRVTTRAVRCVRVSNYHVVILLARAVLHALGLLTGEFQGVANGTR